MTETFSSKYQNQLIFLFMFLESSIVSKPNIHGLLSGQLKIRANLAITLSNLIPINDNIH